jgi:hypothetical protein
MAITYPKADVVDLDSSRQQRVRKSQLTKCLDGLGLQAVGSSSRGLVFAVVNNDWFDAISCQVAADIGQRCSNFATDSWMPAAIRILLRQHQTRWSGADNDNIENTVVVGASMLIVVPTTGLVAVPFSGGMCEHSSYLLRQRLIRQWRGQPDEQLVRRPTGSDTMRVFIDEWTVKGPSSRAELVALQAGSRRLKSA